MTMFEREVKFIYDFNSTKVKKLGSTATYMELIPLKLHPAIMQYISAEIEYRVYEDRQTLLKHSMFDYTGREIAKHFQGIADEIKKEKRFSTEFISKVILHATSFNINHLIRPNWSLKKLIFDTSESSPIEEINQILNYAYFYKHVPNVLREYFEKKKLITMDKNQFGELLERVDGASFEQYGKDLLDSAVKSMASFFNIGSMNQSKVPLQAIGVYLTEKHLTEHMAKLEKDLEGETKSKIELTDLRNILFDVPIETTETYEPREPEGEQLELEEEEIITESPQTKSEDLTAEELNEEFEVDEEIKESPTTEEETEERPEPVKSDADEIEEEKEFDEDVEIKLRANKEKEVFEREPEPDEEIETYEEEPEELVLEDEMNPDEDDENLMKEQEMKNDEAVEHLVQETEKKSEIILTPEEEEAFEEDDESEMSAASFSEDEFEPESESEPTTDELEETNTDTFDEIILEDDTEQLEIVEEEDETYFEEHAEDEKEQIEESQTLEQPKLEDEEEKTDIQETEHETPEDEYDYDFESFDDYSYPELGLESKDEKDKPESEMVDEEEEKEDAVSEDDEIDQSTLFGDLPDDDEDTLNEISDPEEKEDFIRDYAEPKHAKKIDIADLLENKNMTKIIAVVFDYDMEEFANAIERICESSTSNEAFTTLSEIFEFNDVNPSSKEAEAFKEIIAEYFEQN